MAKQVTLKTTIRAEGTTIPAGTLCTVEKHYPLSRTYDLIAGDVLFWAHENDLDTERVERA